MAGSSSGTGSGSRPAYPWGWTVATTPSTPSVRRDGLGLASVMRGLELAGITNDRSTQSHAVGATYLAVITCRYLAGAELELGDAIAAGISRPQPGHARRPALVARAAGDGAPWLSATRSAGGRGSSGSAHPTGWSSGCARCIALWGTLTSPLRLRPSVHHRRRAACGHHDALPHPRAAPRGRPSDRQQGDRLLRPQERPRTAVVPGALPAALAGAPPARSGRGHLREQRLLPVPPARSRSASPGSCPTSRSW